MLIPRPNKKKAAIADFIAGAPDAQGTSPASKQNKKPISLKVPPSLLASYDAKAGKLGQSRASLIVMAMYWFLENGPFKEE